ncbi:snake venom 5'-nucleotidase-like [Liolophura sinensis]|uniref:snake venom 5'-nucleotidase-like n=1 Tax=Liolophura sinensis TaxID=3198878 RepID=UPI00315891A6
MKSTTELKCFVLLIGVCALFKSVQTFNLTIVHTNDVHARFEEANAEGGKCKNESKVAGLCFGGVARRLTKIRELNNTNQNMILIDAGDQYQGTLWFNVFKGHAAAHFMNRLGYQAMAIGNHEFDLGVAGVRPILTNTTFPVLSSNIDASKEPSIDGLFQKSTVLTVAGEKIGIIGYTTPDTPTISNTGKLIFRDEVETIQPIINEMKTQGINKIIALGHSGYARDQELARQLTDVDIIVGGHSHTFLYTGTPPTDDEVIGPYPTIVEKSNGEKVLIVQDFFFGKFLGFLKVQFTDDGKVESWEGDPILLNASIPEDPTILQEMQYYKEQVMNISRQTIGASSVYLEGRRTVCRLEECNLGNLIADSMVWKMSQLPAPNGTWIKSSIALMNSGGIRTSIEKGAVSMEDILTVMPFQNYIDVINVTGKVLLKALEHAVAKYDHNSPRGEFLQVAGLQIVYDLKKPSGKRLVNVRVLCQRCDLPHYQPVNVNERYSIVLPTFTADGGDGFDFELGKGDRISPGFLDSDLFTSYVKHFSPLYKSVEGRIRFCGEDDSIYCPKPSTPSGAFGLQPSSLGVVIGVASVLLRLLAA